jgi:dihydrofolate synthase / folylpolyglutamate synthase
LDPLAYLSGLEQFGIKFGLANISALVERLGHPERAFRSVHIAGTNGKGSVTAMVDAALRAAGHHTARYTSPHLVDLSERFVVDGRAVTPETMAASIARVRDAAEALRAEGVLDVQPTFFEATTAVAFELFRRAGVEVAVVEVGMGGRLDATNVLTPEATLATAITTIAFDHERYLGPTLRDIAFEKAGIIKRGVPVVVGALGPDAAAVIEQVARERSAPLVHAAAGDAAGRAVGLRGLHQRANAAVATRLLEAIDGRGIGVPSAAVDAGLTGVKWPGRLDLRRLADGREVLLDAAHNPEGAAALAEYLRSLAGPRLPLVFAAMRDKDTARMFSALLPAVASLTITRASNRRSADPEALALDARAVAPTLPIVVEPSLGDALSSAWRPALPAPPAQRILVAGSIFLLGDAMQLLGLHC